MDYETAWPELTFQIKSRQEYHLVMEDYVEDEVISAQHKAMADELEELYNFALNLEITHAT